MNTRFAQLRHQIFFGIVGVVAGTGATLAADSPAIHLVRKDQTIDVMVGDELFTTYHFADDFILPYTRPFFWPVKAPDGTELTNDQAQTIKDHPHQRSIWIGHGDVNGAEHWKVTHKPIQPKQRHIDFATVSADGFTEDLIWEDKDAQPMLKEERSFRFIAYPDGARGMDASIKLTPIKDDVKFGTGRDHGFFSVRMLPVIGDHAHFLNSEGATTDEEVINKRADWCDEMGQIDNKTYGVAILDAPDNTRHPPYWHAHSGDRLMADIFGPKPKSGAPALPDAGPVNLKVGDTLSLHYRAIFHDGDAKSADIARKWTDFAAGK